MIQVQQPNVLDISVVEKLTLLSAATRLTKQKTFFHDHPCEIDILKVTHLLDFLRYRGMYFPKVKHWFEYQRDPDDEPYINLAIEAEADFIISRDSDLLDLMNWKQPNGRAFQRRFRSLKIVSPIEFLKIMEK